MKLLQICEEESVVSTRHYNVHFRDLHMTVNQKELLRTETRSTLKKIKLIEVAFLLFYLEDLGTTMAASISDRFVDQVKIKLKWLNIREQELFQRYTPKTFPSCKELSSF